jgi:YD repeat-containing protein
VLTVLQVILPIAPQVLAGENIVTNMAPPVTSHIVTPPSPPVVTVNRVIPSVTPPSAEVNFSEMPADAEITRAHIFAGPLLPIGTTTPQDNQDLANALMAFLHRNNSDDFAAIEQFLETHPESAWRASLLTDLGLAYRQTGWFSKALACWDEAWQLAKNETDSKTKVVADQALGELLELNARLGRYDKLEALFAETKGRVLNSAVSEKIAGAREGLWLMQNRPENAFRCGPMALNQILAFQKPGNPTDKLIMTSHSTPQGMSLSDVCDLANQLGMNFQMAKRSPGSAIILPVVVHWKVGHYASLLKEVNGRYLVQDPTFGDELWVSQAALDAEASGYCLVRAGNLPAGWSQISPEEGQTVWGKGNTGNKDKNKTKPTDRKSPDCPKNTAIPMAQYAFHSMLVSLNIVDTPVGYTPPRGPDVHFQVTYNQREANHPPTFSSNMGTKWTFNWLAFISDNPTQLGGNVDYYVQGGGTESYPGSSYNSSTKTYAADPDTQASLQIVSPTNYTRILPDGSKQIFSVPNAPTNATARQVFLKQIVDAAGNTLTFNYDSQFRLVNVVDALGQVTTLAYA